jgi:hypothetical protein
MEGMIFLVVSGVQLHWTESMSFGGLVMVQTTSCFVAPVHAMSVVPGMTEMVYWVWI